MFNENEVIDYLKSQINGRVLNVDNRDNYGLTVVKNKCLGALCSMTVIVVLPESHWYTDILDFPHGRTIMGVDKTTVYFNVIVKNQLFETPVGHVVNTVLDLERSEPLMSKEE